MIECICGKQFNNQRGFNAHRFYCPTYVSNLSKSEKEVILSRKAANEAKKEDRRQKKLKESEENAHACPICGNIVINVANRTECCSRRCAGKLRQIRFTDAYKHDLIKKATQSRQSKYESQRKQRELRFIQERHACEQCRKLMTMMFGSGRFCSKQCSDQYCAEYGRLHREEFSERTKKLWEDPMKRNAFLSGQHRAIAEGRWPSMMKSNTPSYPETYWMQILSSKNIEYEYDYLVKHSDLGVTSDKLTWYKLDFYLPNYNVDLEIDGSQHAEQVEHDKLRDFRLTNAGYKVYRIPWKGYWKVAEQLDHLKEFLQSIDDPNSSTDKNKKADAWGIVKITESEFRSRYM